jgi:probable phosphoglycerate mutase
VQVRAVAALEQLAALHGDSAIVIVSHADVIKVIIAHYAGIHLDLFQRLVIAPASISIIGISGFAPAIFNLNDTHHYDEAKPAKE